MAQSSGRTAKIWRDGELVDWADANLHVMSHVIHYGSAVFEGMRSYETPAGGAVFRLRDHMRRLHDSAKIYELPLKWTVDELCDATIETLVANDLAQCYLRPLVVRTGEQMSIYAQDEPVETFIICWNWGKSYLPHVKNDGGANVCVSTWRRAAPNTFPAMAKASGNYLNAQLAKMESVRNGYDEAIMLDINGHVAEGSGQNLFLVRDGELITSPVASGILSGITRDSVSKIAADFGIAVREIEIPREMLYLADEAFFCGTAVEITPVVSVDRHMLGDGKPGPITTKIRDRFMGIVTGRAPDPHGWLTSFPVSALAAK
ncbi:MAG: branched-chain amino acid transaminase [Gemmatimonadetes bacterium]|nr:branched-chain amino acid transaminase [Gemmatimonadota bacterium]